MPTKCRVYFKNEFQQETEEFESDSLQAMFDFISPVMKEKEVDLISVYDCEIWEDLCDWMLFNKLGIPEITDNAYCLLQVDYIHKNIDFKGQKYYFEASCPDLFIAFQPSIDDIEVTDEDTEWLKNFSREIDRAAAELKKVRNSFSSIGKVLAQD